MSAALRLQLHLQRDAFALAVDLCLNGDGVTVIYGRSGSGKTTLLRAIAGLEHACNGVVQLGDSVWQDSLRRMFVPTWQRPLAYVFQEANLFEHLSVQKNIEFGWRRRQPCGERTVVDNAIELLDIAPLLSRPVSGLSGGERQRVALARALASRPQLLLLDEPLAAIDQSHREQILPWLERVRDHLAVPMVYVTHSVNELCRLGHNVVELDHGQVRRYGALNEVLTDLDAPFLYGDDVSAVINAQVTARDHEWHLMRVDFGGAQLWLRDSGAAIGSALRLRLLARDISISLEAPSLSSIQNHVVAELTALREAEHPSQMTLRLRCCEHHLLARITRRAAAQLQLHIGQSVWLQIKSAALLD